MYRRVTAHHPCPRDDHGSGDDGGRRHRAIIEHPHRNLSHVPPRGLGDDHPMLVCIFALLRPRDPQLVICRDARWWPQIGRAIRTSICTLAAIRLLRPIDGWFVLCIALDDEATRIMRSVMRSALITTFGRSSQHAPLPIVDLGDGRTTIRFVARHVPLIMDRAGRRLIVQPGRGSLVQVTGELRPMASCIGIIPIMHQIRVLSFVDDCVGGKSGVVR